MTKETKLRVSSPIVVYPWSHKIFNFYGLNIDEKAKNQSKNHQTLGFQKRNPHKKDFIPKLKLVC